LFGTHWSQMVRKTDSETSREAAKKVNTNNLEEMVYEVIKSFPDGCIQDDVISAIPNAHVQSISPRFAALVKKGYIVRTGEKRMGKLGSKQSVLKVKEE
jgi:predicted subunit of tRNA(5-methylaminomethyl-2-thiouridylate) methyltransferase